MTPGGDPLDPIELLTAWLPANDDPVRPQVQLSTVDEDGRPDLRTVLLSEWDADGFVFHTDAASRKAGQLAGNPAVAMLLLWPGFTRQLVIRGRAEPADEQRLARGFAARSPYLKQLAWQNSAENAREERAARVARWQAFATAQDPATLAAPATWTGYLVRPDRLTFWQSDPDGPSHRVEHRRGDGGWSVHHLAG